MANYLSDTASFNTSALTGESKPDTKAKGETVLAGMINLNTVAQVKVTTAYTDSKFQQNFRISTKRHSTKSPNRIIHQKICKNLYPDCSSIGFTYCSDSILI
jgi:Cd2+/Zn2+-exporting ATPase